MVVGVIIPDRGDRPQFLKHLFFMLDRQTVKPDFIELVNYKAISKAPDLTPRIRFGFDSLKKKGCDVVLIMENDDFYPRYNEAKLGDSITYFGGRKLVKVY